MAEAERSEHVRRLSRAVERATDPEAARRLRFERALWAGDVGEVLGLLGDAHPDVARLGPGGCALFHSAIGIAPPEILQALLDRGADVNYEATDGFPALVSALVHETDPERRRAVVRLLLDAGADVHRYGINGWAPLHAAALTDDPALIRMILDAGANPAQPTQADDRWTAAEEADHLGHPAGAEAIRRWVAEHR